MEDFINLILRNKHPARKSTDGREISVRCPYCGDSHKSATSTHFYISTSAPFAFNCKRCGASGVLNNTVLNDLMINDSELGRLILEANINLKKDSALIKKPWKEIKNTTLPSVYYPEKLEYLENRYNLKFDPLECVNTFKTIFSFKQLVEDNKLSIDPKLLETLESDYIGFLSFDKAYAVCRDITGKHNKRYYNWNIYNIVDQTINKFYTIGKPIDILSKKLTLVMCEGIFDIIGVYKNFYKSTNDPNIAFAACAGTSYNAVINHFIRMGFLDLKIVIYSDNDVDDNFYRKMRETSNYINNLKINIIRNTADKDFGVPMSKINPVLTVI